LENNIDLIKGARMIFIYILLIVNLILLFKLNRKIDYIVDTVMQTGIRVELMYNDYLKYIRKV
jgi:regulatory protein YycI of two-component signal transduction system YycFG